MKDWQRHLANVRKTREANLAVPGTACYTLCEINNGLFKLYYVHSESKKLNIFSFEHNFCKYCPILIILSLLQTEIICPQTHNWISHFTYSCCCSTLKNATAYTSS